MDLETVQIHAEIIGKAINEAAGELSACSSTYDRELTEIANAIEGMADRIGRGLNAIAEAIDIHS